MKLSIKYLSILLFLGSTAVLTSCSKDDGGIGCDPVKDESSCDNELIFMDHAFCSGAWFKTTTGEYLEVYGYDTHKLKKGDRVKLGVLSFDNSHLIECTAISPFEVWLAENGHKYRTVKANPKCIEDNEPTNCDTELECVDLGICGGIWFKDKAGNYLEVYGYPDAYKNTLKVGDVVRFGYELHTRSGNVCLAMTEWEVKFYESKQPYKVVKAKEDCFDWCGTPKCETKVTYWKPDICNGSLIKTQDGTLLRAFGLESQQFNEGDVFYISYADKRLQNDCAVERPHNEIGKPVDITCFQGE